MNKPKATDLDNSYALAQAILSSAALVVAFSLGATLVRRLAPFDSGSASLGNHFLFVQDIPAAFAVLLFYMAAFSYLKGNSRLPKMEPIYVTVPVVLLCAILMALGTYAGSSFVFSRHGLSADEFMVDFDARIFSQGRILAPIPLEWSRLGLEIPYSWKHPTGLYWSSSYLPMNAAIRAAFERLGDGWFANSFLTASSILLIASVTRQLFPKEPESQFVAIMLFVTSAQLIITGMTQYAMTAHLTMNLAWLYLFLRDKFWGHALAGLISFVACGLHQVVFHPLFAGPFLGVLLVKRRWRVAAYYAFVLGGSVLFWGSYFQLVAKLYGSASNAAEAGPLSLVNRGLSWAAGREWADVWRMLGNLFRFYSWQNPILLPLLILAFMFWRAWSTVGVALIGGILATIVFVAVVAPSQGFGWGYRYLHGFLGSFALLGALGWQQLSTHRNFVISRARKVLLLSASMSLFVLVPVRIYQAYTLALPYVAASKAIRSSAADVVIVDTASLWFGFNLIQNDPFLLRRPIVTSLYTLSKEDLQTVCRNYTVEIFDAARGAAAGIRVVRGSGLEEAVARELWDALNGVDCHLVGREESPSH